MMRWFALSLLACLVAVARPASAHKPSDSYLTLSSQAEVALVRWDIALRDLDEVVGLDTDGDGNVTWGELERAKPLVFATCLRSLQLSSAGQSCRGEAVKLRAIRHSDGAYAVVDLRFVCAGPIERADVKYDLLFDVDAQHRGIAHVGKQGSPVTFSAGERLRTLDFTGASAPGLGSLIGLGALHIWHGYDHLLFLLALLLPAVVRRSEAHWVPVASFGPTLVDVLRVVTAFTLAHSVTLGLATFGWVALPSRLVESAIALSVVLAALNNLFPIVGTERWAAAFGLGLLHGFGFAAALGDLGLSGVGLARSLFGFNLGVELGQVSVVLVLLPLAYLTRRRPGYARWALGAGSIGVALIASFWLIERAFGLSLIS